jgi:hypothetical protein
MDRWPASPERRWVALVLAFVDALVMAAASIHSDTVHTSDVADLERLLDVFPSVRVEPV